MRRARHQSKFLAALFFGLVLLLAMPAISLAQGRGRGRGRGPDGDKKCPKFVNCHDASEGRLDGRGPRRGTDSDNWNSRHSHRGRDFDNSDHGRHRRLYRDRNFDRNGDRRHHNREMRRHRTWTRHGR